MDSKAYDKILSYVDYNPIATLGTLNLDGSPYGAVVYVCADDHRHVVYFLTKNKTKKYENLVARDRVSLTIVNPAENSTLQASGRAFVVDDTQVIDAVIKKVTRAHVSAAEWLPPIAKLHAGAFVVVGVEIWHARLAQFKGMTIGSEHIFTQA
ncbi:MAG: pyridoxamine 5'-phosphate oxidase family protein [Candidatus Saccharimonadales bacterium]